MRISRRANKHRKVIIFVIAAILLAVSLVVVYKIFFKNEDPTTSFRPEYPQSLQEQKDDLPTDSNKTPSQSSTLPQTTEEIPIAQAGQVTISNLNQKDGFINALAVVDNFSATSCVYFFSSEGARPIVREQSGSCAGVSIPQVEFDKIGDYTLTVTVYDGSQRITTTKMIKVN